MSSNLPKLLVTCWRQSLPAPSRVDMDRVVRSLDRQDGVSQACVCLVDMFLFWSWCWISSVSKSGKSKGCTPSRTNNLWLVPAWPWKPAHCSTSFFIVTGRIIRRLSIEAIVSLEKEKKNHNCCPVPTGCSDVECSQHEFSSVCLRVSTPGAMTDSEPQWNPHPPRGDQGPR